MSIINPYEGVDWEKTEYLHSFSHQHLHEDKLEEMWKMGYRHLPISNYYPSRPRFPLPESFLDKYPALGSPNAEQHSLLDSDIHYNAIGSHYDTGYGHHPRIDDSSPVEAIFEDLNIFDTDNSPWLGIYRLDLRFEARHSEAKAVVRIGIEGAVAAERNYAPVEVGAAAIDWRLDAESPQSHLLKTLASTIRVTLEYDPATTRITQFRMMQGTNRLWRDSFRAALDGTRRDENGNLIEGLMYTDGGGITINHPSIGADMLAEMLDFDERVLGIEVWNQHTFFGGGLTLEGARTKYFYRLWDEILSTGRRCYGFFVKDHCIYGRGRNVLLVPPSGDLAECEHKALRAYRNGQFFGSIGAMAVDSAGKPTQPYDHSDFRFTRIEVGDKDGRKILEVRVEGGDRAARPHTQIRFVTDLGMEIVSGAEGYFRLPLKQGGGIGCKYVRIEAFAFPASAGGVPLTHESLAKMDVFEIARLHEVRGDSGVVYMDAGKGTPLGVVDMIFSQPILFIT